MADGKKVTVILLAVLLAVLGVSAAVLWFLPNIGPTTPTATPTPGIMQKLDTTVLQRSDYNQLDTTLLQQGALPVQPPAVTGKANPFL